MLGLLEMEGVVGLTVHLMAVSDRFLSKECGQSVHDHNLNQTVPKMWSDQSSDLFSDKDKIAHIVTLVRVLGRINPRCWVCQS